MKYDEDRDEFILSTGKRLQSNNGILGISPGLGLYEGYDGKVRGLTAEEIVEVADHAIALWQRAKTSPGGEDE